ncbi:MAG: 6-bladed beta-propeller, partial [Tannerella sp.]|nr:6-bladed beta-propeller [Tannerella sp.]
MSDKIYTLFFFVLFLFLFGIIACSPNRKNAGKIENTTLSLDTTFSELSDSSFVPTRIICMNVNNDNIYFSDYSEGIVILDKSYNVKEKIGRRGEGPGEFLGAAHFYAGEGDSIYILNEGKHAIELFVKGKYLKRIHYPDQAAFTDCTRFFFENQLIFHSVISDSLSIIAFDNNS